MSRDTPPLHSSLGRDGMRLGEQIHAPVNLAESNVLARGTHAGYEWVVGHNDYGARVGYVRVEPGHPWHGQQVCADVHGGVTWCGMNMPAENDESGLYSAWWVGFDCGHAWDLPDPALPNVMPAFIRALMPKVTLLRAQVRTQKYVEAECRSLCEQAARAVASGAKEESR